MPKSLSKGIEMMITPGARGPSPRPTKLFSHIACLRYRHQGLGDWVMDGTGGTGGGAEPESLRAVSRKLLELTC